MLCPGSKQAVELGREVWGERHPSYASVLGALADALYSVGDLGRSQPSLNVALTIRRELGLSQHVNHLLFLENLVKIHGEPANLTKPDPSPKRLLNWPGGRWVKKATATQTRSPSSAMSCGSRRTCRRDRRLFEQERALRRELVGEKHPTFAYCLNRLGRVCQDEGDLDGRKRYTYRRWTSSLSRSDFPAGPSRSGEGSVLERGDPRQPRELGGRTAIEASPPAQQALAGRARSPKPRRRRRQSARGQAEEAHAAKARAASRRARDQPGAGGPPPRRGRGASSHREERTQAPGGRGQVASRRALADD